ncbi:MAG: glycosyltransferase [Rhizomicrobium sp.]
MTDEFAVTLVTVTYGRRLNLLSQLLDYALEEDCIENVVVVNNGLQENLSAIQAKWRAKLRVVDLGGNAGSAVGYAAGIKEAISINSNVIWLMDDDNVPLPGTLHRLLDELGQLSSEVGREKAATLGLRIARAASAALMEYAYAPNSNFMGFDARVVFAKLYRAFKTRLGFCKALMPPTISIPYSPYGGFMAHREAFEVLGLPRQDFVLYADDWEYTRRLTKAGGAIRLVTNAIIKDVGTMWQAGVGEKISFRNIITTTSKVRLYYTFRNHVWLNKSDATSNSFYTLNKYIYISIAFFITLFALKPGNFLLICQAISDGELGKLGENPSFQLDS